MQMTSCMAVLALPVAALLLFSGRISGMRPGNCAIAVAIAAALVVAALLMRARWQPQMRVREPYFGKGVVNYVKKGVNTVKRGVNKVWKGSKTPVTKTPVTKTPVTKTPVTKTLQLRLFPNWKTKSGRPVWKELGKPTLYDEHGKVLPLAEFPLWSAKTNATMSYFDYYYEPR